MAASPAAPPGGRDAGVAAVQITWVRDDFERPGGDSDHAHVAVGAALLATSLALTLRAYRLIDGRLVEQDGKELSGAPRSCRRSRTASYRVNQPARRDTGIGVGARPAARALLRGAGQAAGLDDDSGRNVDRVYLGSNGTSRFASGALSLVIGTAMAAGGTFHSINTWSATSMRGWTARVIAPFRRAISIPQRRCGLDCAGRRRIRLPLFRRRRTWCGGDRRDHGDLSRRFTHHLSGSHRYAPRSARFRAPCRRWPDGPRRVAVSKPRPGFCSRSFTCGSCRILWR